MWSVVSAATSRSTDVRPLVAAARGKPADRRPTIQSAVSVPHWRHGSTPAAAGGAASTASDGATAQHGVGPSRNILCKGGDSNDIAVQLAAHAWALSKAPPHEALPAHVAAVMGGTASWAAARGLDAVAGYQAGIDALRTVARCCQDWGVKYLTVSGFSSEDWLRPAQEVDALLALMERALEAEVAGLAAQGVRLRFIGELGMLPRSLQCQIRSAELATEANSGLHLTIALSTSGRQDLTLAVQEIARLSAAGKLRPCDVTPALISQHLSTQQLPAEVQQPDLVIRTGGERRLSNFLLWESAYSELYFTDVLWPDFGESELLAALREYGERCQRRCRNASKECGPAEGILHASF